MDDDHRQRVTRATRSLQAWLDPLAFTDLHRSDVTALVTEHVVAWARTNGFLIRTQVPSIATRPSSTGQQWRGRLDLACIRPGGQKIAIEIDASNKLWSIHKLTLEAR